MMDRQLHFWSRALLVLALVTIVLGIAAPFQLLFTDTPLVLARGTEVWKTTLRALPPLDIAVVLGLGIVGELAWLYCVAQILILALAYRRGDIFGEANSRAFIRIGAGLGVAGVFDQLAVPVSAAWLYWRGIAPWMLDVPLLFLIDPSLLMAGAFFYVIGRIMRRGAQLQAADDLTI